MIDTNSPTWKHIEKFIKRETTDAVAYLIQDMDSEQQRGIIKVLERLKAEAITDTTRVISDDYS